MQKNWGVKDFILIVGSRLVSGKYPEPEEPYGVSKGRNPPSELYIYWNDNCGSNFEANMAEIEARLVGMIQAPTRIFTQFRMKNFKNRH